MLISNVNARFPFLFAFPLRHVHIIDEVFFFHSLSLFLVTTTTYIYHISCPVICRPLKASSIIIHFFLVHLFLHAPILLPFFSCTLPSFLTSFGSPYLLPPCRSLLSLSLSWT